VITTKKTGYTKMIEFYITWCF